MYQGYLRFGCTEVANASRAYHQAEEAMCAPNWLVMNYKDVLAEALNGGVPYDELTIRDSPWYDAEEPASERFYGVYPTNIGGIEDSTATATITEGILNGGDIAGSRHAARRVQVDAYLLAEGDDALEYGLSWLKAVLEPSDCPECSMHQGSCGEVEMQFFAYAPPERIDVTDYTEWEPGRENLAIRPVAVDPLGAGWTSSDNTRYPREFDGLFLSPSGNPSVKSTRLATSPNASVLSLNAIGGTDFTNAGSPVVEAGKTYSYSLLFAGGAPGYLGILAVAWYNASGVAIGTPQTAAPVALDEANTWVLSTASFTAPAGAVSARLGALVNLPSGVTVGGETAWVADALLTEEPTSGPFFSGDSAEGTTRRFSWSGTPNASTSLEEQRDSFTRPQTDEEYQVGVDRATRVIHGVTRISGPLLTSKNHRPDQGERGIYGYGVRFILGCETAFVYSLPRTIEAQPVSPQIVQDIPYNLAMFPSAELAGPSVEVARNYSTNPSVETNATGWTGAGTAVSGSSPAPFVTTGRSTELAASGLASFRTRLLGNGTVASGLANLSAGQTVPLAGITAGSRISTTMWAAALISAGAGVSDIHAVFVTATFNDTANTVVQIGQTSLDPESIGGHAYSAESIAIPAGATTVRLSAEAAVDWASGTTNSDIRLYVDSLAVTVP